MAVRSAARKAPTATDGLPGRSTIARSRMSACGSMRSTVSRGGRVLGYSVDICRHLAAAIAQELGLKAWRIAYRPVTSATRFDAVERGEIDLKCGSTTNTAARRARVAFTTRTSSPRRA